MASSTSASSTESCFALRFSGASHGRSAERIFLLLQRGAWFKGIGYRRLEAIEAKVYLGEDLRRDGGVERI